MNLREKLRAIDTVDDREETDSYSLAVRLGASPQKLPGGTLFRRRRSLSPGYRHGGVCLPSLQPAGGLAYLIGRIPGIRPEDVLFLDTETTGLSSGPGTYVFLVGLGYVDGGKFHVDQIFLPGPHAEAAFLTALEEALRPFRILITFNGKCFDWNLLTTRFILNRRLPPEAGCHLDLLYPARRIFGASLSSCSLGELERSVLSFRRQGDVPGELIPHLYFRFLRDGHVEALPAVLDHNLLDILSLAALFGRICDLLTGRDDPSPAQALGVAHYHERRGQLESALRLYLRAAAPTMPDDYRVQALRYASLACKRTGRWREADALWTELCDQRPEDPFAYVERAKYYEHRLREFRQALDVVERALATCQLTPKGRAELQHRRRRLLGRLAHKPSLA